VIVEAVAVVFGYRNDDSVVRLNALHPLAEIAQPRVLDPLASLELARIGQLVI
jgi:hypothetical protein